MPWIVSWPHLPPSYGGETCPPVLSRDDAVIVISHRGTKTYSFLSLELAKDHGAFTVAIT